jgi:hypothetical protein
MFKVQNTACAPCVLNGINHCIATSHHLWVQRGANHVSQTTCKRGGLDWKGKVGTLTIGRIEGFKQASEIGSSYFSGQNRPTYKLLFRSTLKLSAALVRDQTVMQLQNHDQQPY